MKVMRKTSTVSLLVALFLGGAADVVSAAKLKLIEQKPIFDTSILPKSPFRLQLKHTNIVYPKDTPTMLHGDADAKVVNLRAEQNSVKLIGNVAETAKESGIDTIERGLKSRFHLDLVSLIPKLAPDISRQLDAQLEQSKRNLAARVEAEAPQMDLQRRTPKTAPIIPALQPHLAQAKIPLTASIPKSSPALQQTAKEMQSQLEAAKGKIATTAGISPSSKLPNAPLTDAKLMNQQLTNAKLLNQQATNAKLMNEQLTNAKLINTQLQPKLISNDVRPDLAALATQARRLPTASLPKPSSNETMNEDTGAKAILWDAWHKRFAQLAGDSLIKAVNKAENPMGTNTVSITVWPNQQLEVALTKTGNKKFDGAVLEAYKSLNGNAQLAYPAGSLRSSISFFVDNKHTIDGIASYVRSRTTKGDKEILHHVR